jgi:hypothetical protein
LQLQLHTGQLLSGAASSGQAKGVVTSFAEGVLLKEKLVKLTELDVSYWVYWLSTCGYSSQVSELSLVIHQGGSRKGGLRSPGLKSACAH